MHSDSEKRKAINLRRNGISIIKISSQLNLPKSTLSGWFKDIKLSKIQKNKLKRNSEEGLRKARIQAVKWHNKQKAERIATAKDKASKTLLNINLEDESTLKLSLSLMYLGEGFKNDDTGMGNSDVRILKFFVESLRTLYELNYNDFYFDLHLRADQNKNDMKQYWSKELKIPEANFKNAFFDKRTLGRKTYENYKGVCSIRVGRVAILRELMFLSTIFCDKVSQKSD